MHAVLSWLTYSLVDMHCRNWQGYCKGIPKVSCWCFVFCVCVQLLAGYSSFGHLLCTARASVCCNVYGLALSALLHTNFSAIHCDLNLAACRSGDQVFITSRTASGVQGVVADMKAEVCKVYFAVDYVLGAHCFCKIRPLALNTAFTHNALLQTGPSQRINCISSTQSLRPKPPQHVHDHPPLQP